MPHYNKFGVHMPPVYRVIKPNEVPAETATVDEDGLEFSDVYPLQLTSATFTREDISNNNPTAVPSTFILTDYLKKP